MKITLISKVPPYFQLKKSANQTFPPFQTQTYWLNAFEALKFQTSVFLYSKSVVVSDKLAAKYAVIIQKKLPWLFAKWQNATNKLYRLNLFNYIRTIQLFKHLRLHHPQYIVVSGGVNGILAKPLILAKNSGAKLYLLNGESPHQSATQFEKEYADLFDYIIVNDYSHVAEWQKLGARNVIALPYASIDPQVHFDRGLKRSIPLLFIGTLLADRQAILTKLIQFQPKIYGYVPPEIGLDPKLKPFYHGEAWGEKMISLLNQAQIALNFSPAHMPFGGNLRLFEIPGCGPLQIADHCPAEWFIENKEIVLFNNDHDLFQKIEYYLNHASERQKIARTGYRRTHQNYTYYQRFKTIFSYA